MEQLKTLGVIPARYAATRFPGKPLVEIKGKSMIQRVYEQVCRAKTVDQVLIATDNEQIVAHVKSFGAPVMMTADDHPSGTDRVAEVARAVPEYGLILNVQGDEPFIDPEQLDQLCQKMLDDETSQIGTLAVPIREESVLSDPNQVKVVLTAQRRALYFSRQAIPFLRNVSRENWLRQNCHYKHLGVYAFRRETLLAITQLPVGQLERQESLEQLRWLENGFSIQVEITDRESISIDTPEDLAHLLRQLRGQT